MSNYQGKKTMGLLNALGFVGESKLAPVDGSHSLDHDRIHGASNAQAITPDNVPDEAWDTIRPFPVWAGQHLMSEEESGAIVEHCKEFKNNVKATEKALDEMIDTLDKPAASINQKKQKYIRAEGRFERRTVGYKHTTGKYLQGQRPSYAKLGTDYKNAELAADNAIAALAASL